MNRFDAVIMIGIYAFKQVIISAFLSLETNKPLILYILIFKRSLIAEYFVL